MSDATTLLFVFSSLALTIGAVFVPVWRRHVARLAKDRAAGRFVPRVDARGLWLVANGPVTLALGLALLAVAGLRATSELAEAKRREELVSVGLRCEAGGRVELELLGPRARRVEVRLAVVLRGDEEGSSVRLSPGGPWALAPGDRRTLTARLAEEDACGAGGGAGDLFLVAPFGAGGPWPDCSGLRFTLTVRDADGGELATGERECAFEGREAPLRLDPSSFDR